MGPHGNRRAPVHAAIDFGMAELRPDPARPRGWTVLVDDVPQSYVDLADPEYMHFPYAQELGRVVRLSRARRVLHLGGGGLTIPRLIAHLRPGTEQLVVDRDAALLTLVERFLPFDDSIRVEIEDARAAVEKAEQYDLIVVDVFVGAAMPASVSSTGFAGAARRALRPDGLLVANLTDVPPLAHTRIQMATIRTAFDDPMLLGPSAVLRGRRAGNVILLAGNVPMIKLGKHERMIRTAELAEFIGGAKPRLDEPA
ncbi:fused MFS/spermidine synthase [Actinoplanes bogorensis]|uniref:Fused MFS/spermidine synthase n=1 Tax=Paractinoplanes bogorensis TaxID=1610840 RepID=A0ABS5YYX7_9ACTN|nr:fused MFS/spermidine synthase [Actinoplanes bogorensis]MBU2668521.1 fused MFS/spermidine synthase [Actinoplanes bogorensis]